MLTRRINRFAWLVKHHGAIEACRDFIFRIIACLSIKNIVLPIYESIDGLNHPVCMRSNTSDSAVFAQIFKQNEYSSIRDIKDVKLIIDCGGYTGLSALWFLNNYPDARVIVIEPDIRNYLILRKNLKFYRDRVLMLNAAVWPYDARLAIAKGDSHWATKVKEVGIVDKQEIESVSVGRLVDESGLGRVDILKIDIEGSEEKLFVEDCKKWLQKVRNIAIELHGKICEEAFFSAMSDYRYELSRIGDIVVLKNIIPKKPNA